MNILENDVQDMGGNTTRFLVIAKAFGKPTGNDKTSVFFAVKHKVGALYESRPSKAKAWEYYFFVDVEGHSEDEHVQKSLSDLSEHCTLMTVLGSYPRAAEADE